MDMPRIKIISMDDVDVHEHTDNARVDRLRYSIKRDAKIRNPVIVSKIADKYMILDGATRHGGLKKLGAKHILAQIADYDKDDLTLDTWDHVITGIKFVDFLEKVKKIKDVTIEESFQAMAEKSLEKKEIFGYFILKEGKTYTVKCPMDYENIVRIICEITKIYTNEEETVRIVHAQIDDYLRVYDNETAIFCTPKFTKEDIKEIFNMGLKVSAGITRHLIPCRILNVNLGLNLLINDDTTESKAKYLDEFIDLRLKHGKVRYYSEPTIVFDN